MEDIMLHSIPLFKGLDRIDLAKLIIELKKKNFTEDQLICNQGDIGDCFYIIIKGAADVYTYDSENNNKGLARLNSGECFGDMALLTGEPRSACVKALTDLEVYCLTKESFDKLINKHHSLAIHFTKVLASRLSNTNYTLAHGDQKPMELCDIPVQHQLTSKAGDEICHCEKKISIFNLRNKKFMFALIGIFLSLSLLFYMKSIHVTYNYTVLIVLLFSAAFCWATNLLSFHVVSIALPLLSVLIGISESSLAFSGFSSAAWFSALGVFAIAAAISRTGLLYRVTLHILKRFPSNYYGQTLALSLTGLILTPLIPSSNARVALASPLALEISEAMGFKRQSAGSAGLALSSLLGFGHMSFMFMNGSTSNFLILGLLPHSTGHEITWWLWLKAAAVMGIAFYILSYISLILIYRPKEKLRLNPRQIEIQLKTLGRMTNKEKISIVTVMITMIAYMTQSLHKIEGDWIALLGFLILLESEVLDEKAVGSEIDWSSLISFGALLGFGNIMNSYQLTQAFSESLSPYVSYFIGNKMIFLLIVVTAVNIIRFILPIIPAQLVIMLTILPLVTAVNISPFIVGLVILSASNPWFMPGQSTLYSCIMKVTENKAFTRKQALKMASVHFLLTLLVTVLSIPYWNFIGLM